MVYYINVLVTNLLIDYLSVVLIKQFFKLTSGFVYLFLIQIFSVAATVIYLFCGLEFYQFLLCKILAEFIIVFLISDSFKFVNILKLWWFYVLIMFSVYGFSEFFAVLLYSLFKFYFDIKIAKNHKFVLIISVFVYFIANFCFFCKMSKNKHLKNNLAKVSFFLYGKHIEITGFLDTGNSLIDKTTGKPVIVISANCLKKYFKNFKFQGLKKGEFCDRLISCECAGGTAFEMPIVKIDKVCVCHDGERKHISCMLGIVNQNFYDEKKYDCLIHRDFC